MPRRRWPTDAGAPVGIGIFLCISLPDRMPMTGTGGLELDPDLHVGYHVRRVQQLTAIGLEPLFAAKGLTLTQWQALVAIATGRGGTSAELSRDLTHDKGATTRLVDVLVRQGWVTRARDAVDRRMVNLALTEEGLALTRECGRLVIGTWEGWLRGWDEGEVAELLRLLRRLGTALQFDLGR